MREYQDIEPKIKKVAEPAAVAYNIDANALKVRGMEMLMGINDPKTLNLVIEDLSALIEKGSTQQSMPCCFSDEEWKEEVRLSEEEGEATDEEVKKFFETWKVAM